MSLLVNHNPKKQLLICRSLTCLHVATITLLFATSFLVNPDFFNSLITAKQWGLEQVLLLTAFFLIVSLPFIKTIHFTIIDLLVIAFCGWHVLSEAIIFDAPYISLSDTIFNVSLWLTVYLFIRSAAQKTAFVWALAIVWMVVSLLQSGLGLMQLYGLKSSYHGLFSITGTFHNPGPFSGFVVSGLPVALGVLGYTESKRSEVPLKRKNRGKGYTEGNEGEGYTEEKGGNTERHGGIFLKWSKINIPFNIIVRYSLLTLAWGTLVAILLVLPPAQSRAAWIAGIAGGLFVLAGHPTLLSLKDGFKSKFLNIRKPLRVLLLTVVLFSTATAGFGLYSIKKGSADGRMLIWQVTSQLIKQNPITGHGSGAFNALYMNEQAYWFESGTGTEAQAMVAGSPESPFNEPLKLWLEKGLIAILLAIGILYFIFVTNNKTVNHKPIPILGTSLRYATLNPYPALRVPILGIPLRCNYRCAQLRLTTSFKGALISLLVFSLFSYPFDICSFVLQLVILVALLAGTSNQMLTITGRNTLFFTIPISIVIILGSIHYAPQRQTHYQAMKTWKQADQLYYLTAYQASVAAYEEAFPPLQNKGLFLQMYGKALTMDEQHQKSNEILAVAQHHHSSQIIQNTLGDNHKALGKYAEAEVSYLKSIQMVPSLLLPKYLLAKLYSESGQHQKAQQTAEEILNSTIKVESSATREIMNKMKNIISYQ
jgi:O-antigen ligase